MINKLENLQSHTPTACILEILSDLEGRKIFEDENLEFGEVEIR